MAVRKEGQAHALHHTKRRSLVFTFALSVLALVQATDKKE